VTPSLPADGPAHEIFLRALRHFSNTCEAPALHPDCPYAVVTSTPGVRGCGEECLNLTAEYGVDATTDRVMDLTGGISLRLRRPRARRDPGPTVKPFDAREIQLQDRPVPVGESWRITSLLMELISELSTPPVLREPGSLERVRDLMGELAKRGVDDERVVRFGLARTISSYIVVAVLVPVLVAHADPDDELAREYRDVSMTRHSIVGAGSSIETTRARAVEPLSVRIPRLA
jgi:hypothetical protein